MTESVNPTDENVQDTPAEQEPVETSAAKPATKKAAAKKPSTKKPAAKKAATKKSAVEGAEAEHNGVAAEDPGEKRPAAKKAGAKKPTAKRAASGSAASKKRLGEKLFSQGTVVAKTSFNGPLTPETDVLMTDPVNPKAIASQARAAGEADDEAVDDEPQTEAVATEQAIETESVEAPVEAEQVSADEVVETPAPQHEEPAEPEVVAAPRPKGPKTTMAKPPKGLTENTPAGVSYEPSKRKRNPAKIIIPVVVIAIIAAFVYFFILPPSLSNNEVLAAFDSSGISSEELTNSDYANNSGYSATGTKVTSIEDVDSGQKTAHVEATFENSNFTVTVECTQAYTLVSHKWNAGEVKIVSAKAKPLTSIDSTKVVSDINNLLSKVPDKNGVKFSDLYTDGTFEVMSNNLNTDKTEATVTIRAKKNYDLYSYSGQITAVFDFAEGSGSSGDAGSWKVTSCKADDAAWQQSYSSLVGTWTGKLENTATSSLILNTGKCNAGKKTPFTMNVESMDTATGSMVATMSFVSHNHSAISQDADSTEGDVTVTATDISVSLDPQTLTGTYEFTGDETQGTYLITLVNDSGVWKVQVASGLYETGTLAGLGHVTFTDVYTLAHS